MDRRIRDKLQIAGASDEYIMSRRFEVSIHKPTDEERRRGQRRRRFFAGPHDYIGESLEYLRAVARRLEMEEPSLLSIERSVDMVILHWLTHDDVRVWRAPAMDAAVGLMTTFFPEILRVEVVHLYDEDTAGKFSYRPKLATSPLPAAMKDNFAAEWQQLWAFGDEMQLIRETAKLFEGLPEDVDFAEAVHIKAKLGSPVAKAWLRKLADEEAAERATR
ncbi:MAG TPA: hypothetical protein VG758_18810 [Hyphomicrobiaceae bacterium]|jgi:hypothetical protein|nr:hypothetical protein [Hyphomicrobiaceae bacterium]